MDTLFNPTTTMFLIGAFLGGGLLVAGLVLGIWIGRRTTASRYVSENQRVLNMAGSMLQWTSEFSGSVAHYRRTLDGLSARCQATSGGDGQPTLVDVLSQVISATENVQDRLVTAEHALQQQATEMATYVSEARTDSLTGLMNRRAIDDELNRRFAEWRRHGGSLSLVLVDVDHFKKFNDTYGHLAGDVVLAGVAHELSESMRESDLVARFGGEEFIALLPSSDSRDATLAAERIRKAIDQKEFYYEGNQLHVTVSCGATEALDGETIESLIHRADDALYASKDAGRNCSHWHDGIDSIRIIEGGKTVQSTPPAAQPIVVPDEFAEVCGDLRQRLQEVTGPGARN